MNPIKSAVEDTFLGFIDITMQWENFSVRDRLFILSPIFAVLLGVVCTVVGNLSGLHFIRLEEFHAGIVLGEMFYSWAVLLFALDVYVFYRNGRGELN